MQVGPCDSVWAVCGLSCRTSPRASSCDRFSTPCSLASPAFETTAQLYPFTQALSVLRVPACGRSSFTYQQWAHTSKTVASFEKDQTGEAGRHGEWVTIYQSRRVSCHSSRPALCMQGEIFVWSEWCEAQRFVRRLEYSSRPVVRSSVEEPS
jgi:hypothetical protein